MNIQSRDNVHIGQRMLNVDLPGGRLRRTPQRRFIDEVKEDMQRVGLGEQYASYSVRCSQMLHCGDP